MSGSTGWADGRLVRLLRRAASPVEVVQVRRFGRSGLSVAFRTPVLVLHTTGRRTGRERSTALAHEPDGVGRWLVVGGAGGQAAIPDWVANLRAQPEAAITVDRRRRTVVAEELVGDERASAWERLRQVWPRIDTYQRRAGRPVPVFRLVEQPDAVTVARAAAAAGTVASGAVRGGGSPMPTGLTADAGWQIGVSRTLDAPIDLVWDLVVSDEGVALWLAPGARLPHDVGETIRSDDGGSGELRSRHARDRVRLRWRPAGWDHTTVVQVAMTAKGERTAVTLHQERLADADERERQRTHWRAAMDRLAAELLPDPSAPAISADPVLETSTSETTS